MKLIYEPEINWYKEMLFYEQKNKYNQIFNKYYYTCKKL